MKRLLYIALAVISTATMLLGANFWEKKKFTEWNDKEVRRMLQDSPWAHEVNVVLMGLSGFGPEAGGAGAPGRGGGAGGGGVGEGGGGRGGRGRGAGSGPMGESELARPTLPLLVQWASALPVKQAMVRSSISSEQAMDENARQFLDREETHYVIAVVGIPARMAQLSEGTERFVETSRIERGKNREPLAPERVEGRPQQNSVTLYFFFPRTNPITPEDKDVQFVFKLENLEVKRKFKLQDMMYEGKLAL
jgi:hypothetical protein